MNSQPIQELPVVVVAAGIIHHEGEILLTRRMPEAHQGGLWEFPGGKQEVDETLEQCLRRELKEEIDLEVTKVKHFCTLNYRYPEKEIELHVFTCSIYSGVPTVVGCAELAWVPKHQLTSYKFPPADLPVLEKIRLSDL